MSRLQILRAKYKRHFPLRPRRNERFVLDVAFHIGLVPQLTKELPPHLTENSRCEDVKSDIQNAPHISIRRSYIDDSFRRLGNHLSSTELLDGFINFLKLVGGCFRDSSRGWYSSVVRVETILVFIDFQRNYLGFDSKRQNVRLQRQCTGPILIQQGLLPNASMRKCQLLEACESLRHRHCNNTCTFDVAVEGRYSGLGVKRQSRKYTPT